MSTHARTAITPNALLAREQLRTFDLEPCIADSPYGPYPVNGSALNNTLKKILHGRPAMRTNRNQRLLYVIPAGTLDHDSDFGLVLYVPNGLFERNPSWKSDLYPGAWRLSPWPRGKQKKEAQAPDSESTCRRNGHTRNQPIELRSDPTGECRSSNPRRKRQRPQQDGSLIVRKLSQGESPRRKSNCNYHQPNPKPQARLRRHLSPFTGDSSVVHSQAASPTRVAVLRWLDLCEVRSIRESSAT
ncbi:hypothetical protein ACW5EG_07335 [Luteimonas sp. A611]